MRFSFYELFSSIVISLLCSILFWSLFPSIVDRSLSVNVLGSLYKANRPISLEKINYGLYQNYMDGDFQALKRINEQIQIGNIQVDRDQNYFLTPKGKKWAKINLWLASHFFLDDKSANPPFF